MKKLLALALTAVVFLGSTLTVNAAGLRDVFSAKYYAEQYPDLKAAYGNDEELLWKHFLAFGLKEGRNMSPVLDVQLYREKYADLDAAFGDNWDAYVDHFFQYGINENRDNGTNFDVKTYVKAYGDIAETFGDDYAAIVEHYLEKGLAENRVLGDPVVYEETFRPAHRIPPVSNAPIMDDCDVEYVYDENGVKIEAIFTYEGKVVYNGYFEYDENGELVNSKYYYVDGFLTMEEVNTEDENGQKIKLSYIYFYPVGYELYTYDMYGRMICHDIYDENGWRYTQERSYPENGLIEVINRSVLEEGYRYWVLDAYENVLVDIAYAEDGSVLSHWTYEYNENWERVSEKQINIDGSYNLTTFDRVDGKEKRTIESYDASGALFSKTVLLDWQTIESWVWLAEGSYIVWTYDRSQGFEYSERMEYAADGTLLVKQIYFDGIVVSEYRLNEDGTGVLEEYDGGCFAERYTYYDVNGNAVKEIVIMADGTKVTKDFDTDGNVTFTTTITYHENGNEAMVKAEWPDGSVVITYYDEDGNIIEEE